ncbi:hypothetical protein [Acetivibrio ethanolgignens]|uniref:Uncharacterized protein n=1 Tax=Acetivibrio ethanolgignens TaxID=290052 RepID=A0A0V8QI92_9FIRM|nr:hypothetical protein [Acetivibrio ethanolgignens]KSV60317.1 hypothetical protein ASU35_06080 [Acetivibrio ethanolgignens]
MYIITDKKNHIIALTNEVSMIFINEEKGDYETTRDENRAIGWMDMENNTIYQDIKAWNVDSTTENPPYDLSKDLGRYLFAKERGFYKNKDWLPPQPSFEDKVRADIEYIALSAGIDLTEVSYESEGDL